MIEKIQKIIKDNIIFIIIVIAIILTRIFIVTLVRVDGASMNNTLKDGDILVENKLNTDYKRFDIVVVKHNKDKLIKRIIGLPGENIKYRNGFLYVNGKKIKEPFIKEKTEDFNLIALGYNKIPKDHYFVVGDNRNNSLDSRILGLFKKDQIKGTVNLRVFPFNKIGKINK